MSYCQMKTVTYVFLKQVLLLLCNVNKILLKLVVISSNLTYNSQATTADFVLQLMAFCSAER